jgi:hypothetical protein
MKPVFVVLAATLFLAAACDRPPQPRTDPAAGAGPSAPVQPMPQTGSAPTKKGSTPPVQGQVDSKHTAQQKDFEQRGDGAGPKPAN